MSPRQEPRQELLVERKRSPIKQQAEMIRMAFGFLGHSSGHSSGQNTLRFGKPIGFTTNEHFASL